MLGEVKWNEKPINGLTLFNDLHRKSMKLDINGRVKYLLISSSGFLGDSREACEKNGALCLDIRDLSLLFNAITKKEAIKQRTLKAFV